MPNIKLVIAYDGTDFFGFQRQPHHRSVQQVLEEALRRIFREPIRVHPAGRTDAGVHARAQVVHFKTTRVIPVARIHSAINSVLPEDVRVLRAMRMKDSFHARFNAKGKRYQYVVRNDEWISPLIRRHVCRYPYALDIVLMQKGAKILEGRHDFRSFQGRANRQDNTVRSIRSFRVAKKGKTVCFVVEGDGFLSNMVRNMVGTLLLVGRKHLSLNDLRNILKGRDRRLAGPTAPARGLTLAKVLY